MAVATLYSVTPFHASLSSSARKIPHPITSFRFNPHSISISRFGSHPPGLFSLSFWSRFSVASIVAPILSSRVLRVHGLVDDDSVTAPEPKSENSKAGATLGLNFPRRSLFVQFTCDLCGERTKRLVNRLAYERGAIFVQDPSSTKGTTSNEGVSKKRPLGVLEQDHVKATGLASISEDSLRKQVKLDHASETEASSLETRTCILEFDGASKGNPGKSGAGAILRSIDGSLIYRLREGVGIATNNAAEYRAMILGMKYALQKGFTGIRIKGDSKLVCMQIDGLWKVKNENLSILYKVAKELKDKFVSFQINHVLREFNSEADAQANLAIHLADGQVHEECVG